MIDLRKVPLRISLPAALLCGASLTFARPMSERPAPEAMVVAVDLERVLTESPANQRLDQDLKALTESFDARMKTLKDEFDVAVATCNAVDPGTDERTALELDVKLKKFHFESTADAFDAKLKQFSLDRAVAVEQEVRRGIAEFAKEKGFKSVLRLRPDPRTSQRLDPERQAKFTQLVYDVGLRRDVLYMDPSVDVTDDVIRFLKQWKDGK